MAFKYFLRKFEDLKQELESDESNNNKETGVK